MMRMLVERERLAQSVQTNIIMDLRKASDKLNESSYGRFKERRFRADKDLLRTEDTDPLTGESVVKVCSARYTDAPPRIFRSPTDRCGCPERLAEEDMCAHEIKAKGGFRLIPKHEQRTIRASDQLNTAIQNLGRKQVVTGKNGVEIEANGKTRVRNCQFCKEQHVYTNCSRRAFSKMTATEYILSESSQFALNQKLLRTYINDSMPHSLGVRGTPFDNLDSKCISSNFIIHEACKDGHKMIYSVSFLNNKAQPDKKLWITTDAMNSVITHTKKKIKFVYVETIFNKPGWVPLQKGDCCAVGVSNDGAVGFCNDGNNGSSDSDDGSDDEKVDHATVADNSKSAASKRKSRVSSIDFADEVHGEERMPKRATAIEGQSYANAAIESRGMMDVQKESV